MASKGKKPIVVDQDVEEPPQEEEEEEEEVERFDDFTVASSWERFISDIEAVCRQWLADGPKNLLEKGAIPVGSSTSVYRVKFELKYAMKSYCMEYYFGVRSDGKTAEWDSSLHDLQLCFGVRDFLMIAPQSASGVVLDSPESSKLLSAVAIALSNCSSTWPAFVPVHDPSRKAYIGIQSMGTVFTRSFEADHIGSQVPIKLMHLEGLYELFISKFAYSTLDFSEHVFRVHFTMRLTYETFAHNDDDVVQGRDMESSEIGGNPGHDLHNRSHWDDDCPWSRWYSAEDPMKGISLVAIWTDKVIDSSSEMAELENATPLEAEKWILSPQISPDVIDASMENKSAGFASQLSLLVDALDMSFQAQFMEDFVSVEKPGMEGLKSSLVIPPMSVVDRILKELFQNGSIRSNSGKGEPKLSRVIKGAPVESLFAEFCLHSLWCGNCNIRAIAFLWIEFVREVRWCWEETQPLPGVPTSGSIDLSTCIVNQKLQMLSICIERKQQQNEEYQDCVGSEDADSIIIEHDGTAGYSSEEVEPGRSSVGEFYSPSTPKKFEESGKSSPRFALFPQESPSSMSLRSSDCSRRGSAGVVGCMKLLKSNQSLHAPFTQDAPLMTEDMHEERLQAVDAFKESFNFSAQLEREILSSDMSAFKAANPDAVFEDFIRWHSPGDWETDEDEKCGPSVNVTPGSKDEWPPRGRLSQRMSDHGNLWRKIWNDAPALPASDQKPLFDPNREGEKVLHYLETIQPHQLLEQMICTSFRAAADTIYKTNFGDLKQMTSRMDQLYATMASMLKPLQAKRLAAGSETIEDLRRLALIFGNVERLLHLAAFLHRKFFQARSLSDAIFSGFFSHSARRMGTGLTKEVEEADFDMKIPVKHHERQVISDVFAPPTVNQSWRKVLSMGNLLNGHEPVLREIIFSKLDSVSSGNQYASETPRGHHRQIEMYRMYISGTSNDLRVALSVASCD
ncbi:hypothetical protein MLD38_017416 [Melastoma candidum]|uniref:Uncharacterized protein n=1 Tax=Melastoma candidum TaxID=119954 RepID=A0ACB9QUN0_9MYRT|nr:hypothetical protein MLD38_017416 [Melastoma candidum]